MVWFTWDYWMSKHHHHPDSKCFWWFPLEAGDIIECLWLLYSFWCVYVHLLLLCLWRYELLLCPLGVNFVSVDMCRGSQLDGRLEGFDGFDGFDGFNLWDFDSIARLRVPPWSKQQLKSTLTTLRFISKHTYTLHSHTSYNTNTKTFIKIFTMGF